jgi:hypothetical protein
LRDPASIYVRLIAFAIPQAQFGPHVQDAPQRHPARRVFRVSWQPQVQVAPAQESHEQVFGVGVLFAITGSFESG